MRGKYFRAAIAEDCYAAAEAYFATPRDRLYCRLTPAEQEGEVLLLAIDPGLAGLAAVNNMDAFFTLSSTEQGICLELFPAHGQGQKLSREDLALYLKRKALTGLNNAVLPLLLDKGWGAAKIAPPQLQRPLDEEASVTVDTGATKAFVTIWPREEGGQVLDLESLHKSIAAAGVVHGLSEDALQYILSEKRFFHNYPIAQASQPINGEAGYLTFHFRRELESRPKEKEDGRVDYRELDLFERVTEGQLLVTRTPPTPGQPGRSVLGKETPAIPGKNVPLPKGKHIRISEDDTELYAAISGLVVYEDGKVHVSNVFTVKGDADMTVGNIDFDGSVIIGGNVIASLTVKASGNIEISGVVESATIIAGGNIVLRRGMQGMNKGHLEAGGSITANYLERATIIAGTDVTANVIAHSIVEAGDSLRLTGKNGNLVGGQARVGNVVWAQTIGSASETVTEISVGMVPQKHARLLFLQQELKRLQEEIEKLSTIYHYLQANPSDDEKKIAMYSSVAQSLQYNNNLLTKYTEELNRLTEESATAVHGKVHVSDTTYRGVRLTIASAIYRVMEDTPHCTFKISDGQIVFGVYEG